MSVRDFGAPEHTLKTKDEFICHVLGALGAPLIQVELTEEMMMGCITDAIQEYRRWESHSKAALAIDPSVVPMPATGIELPDDIMGINNAYQNNANTAGINTLFTEENFLYSQGYYNFRNFDLISWVVLQNWLETKNMVLGQHISYNYNKYSNVIVFTPSRLRGRVILDATVRTPIDCLWNEQWLKRFVINEMKIRISRIRSKHGGTQLLGGGQLSDLITEDAYEARRKELIDEAKFGGDFSDPVDFYVF
jgi:hypothetical protein